MNTLEGKRAICIEDIDSELLKHYIDLRRQIDVDIETIQGITRAFSALNDVEEDLKISASMLGQVCRTLDKHATKAWEALDEFIPLNFAQMSLHARDDEREKQRRSQFNYCP